jgi:hypothetical protein
MKSDDGNSAAPEAGAGKANGKGAASVSHRLTVDLARAETLAQMLAASRAAIAVEVSDLLAGMYIYEWERLSKYWANPEEIEAFLQQICAISPQRWHRWMEHYETKHKRSDAKRAWAFGRKDKKTVALKDGPIPSSAEVQAVLKRAEVITPFHDRHDGRHVPILTSESVLLSIAMNVETTIGKKLAETGLDVEGLRQDVRDRRRAPQNWRDEN